MREEEQPERANVNVFMAVDGQGLKYLAVSEASKSEETQRHHTS